MAKAINNLEASLQKLSERLVRTEAALVAIFSVMSRGMGEDAWKLVPPGLQEIVTEIQSEHCEPHKD